MGVGTRDASGMWSPAHGLYSHPYPPAVCPSLILLLLSSFHPSPFAYSSSSATQRISKSAWLHYACALCMAQSVRIDSKNRSFHATGRLTRIIRVPHNLKWQKNLDKRNTNFGMWAINITRSYPVSSIQSICSHVINVFRL